MSWSQEARRASWRRAPSRRFTRSGTPVQPAIVRGVVLASSAPQGAAGMHGWAPEVIGAVGAPETSPEGYLSVFFAPTKTSLQAGQEAAGRIFGGRTTDRDEPTTWQTRQAQYDAVCMW